MIPAEASTGSGRAAGISPVFAARLATALVPAAALYLLTDAELPPSAWPATVPSLFTPLCVVATFVPLLVMLGVGQVRARPLAIWAAVATVILAGLGYHDATRARVPLFATEQVLWPTTHFWMTLAASLFIAHVLVVDSIIERRLVPPYARHFDTAWKQAVQTVLALVFVGVFWAVLYLGAGLFKLVDIEFFLRLIEQRWFAIPATTLALAASLHVTDVQPALIRGARTLALTLFSWLLPLLAVILLGFLGSIPLISLAPLWKTRFATALLLIAAGLLVCFINCCYQDGAAEQTKSRVKRLAGSVGAIELVPLVGLAAWALSLRVGQYGWTVERVLAAAAVFVAACYAVGYASAVVWTPSWLKRLEITNFATAYVVLAIVLALFSPIADPARLMVADQLARLRSGAVQPDRFDFVALKFDGAKWGAAALSDLSRTASGPDAATIRAKAAEALAQTRSYAANPPDVPRTADALGQRVSVLPAGRALPASFQDAGFWSRSAGAVPECFRPAAATCTARFVTLRPGSEAILFFDTGISSVFEQDARGQWQRTGILTGAIYCASARQSFERGDFTLETHAWPDLVIGNQRLEISPASHPCPPLPPRP